MRFRPMHVVSTALFVITLIVSLIGPYTEGTLHAFMWIWTVLLLVAGWIFHIIGIFKR